MFSNGQLRAPDIWLVMSKPTLQRPPRVIASQLAHMVDRAEAAALPMLAMLLEAARIEAERGARSVVADDRNEPVTPAAISEIPAGIPLMITRRQREQLRELGWSDEQIREMTPEEGHRKLNL